jgi:hypothetical protein
MKCEVCDKEATVELPSEWDKERFERDPEPPELYAYCDEHADPDGEGEA